MTDREKLIELLDKSFRKAEETCGAVACGDCDAYGVDKDLCMLTLVANMLIANGVVVREKGDWEYTDDIDEDGNIQAYCSACGAGDKHATSMVGKVPYCWKCGADMRKGENG